MRCMTNRSADISTKYLQMNEYATQLGLFGKDYDLIEPDRSKWRTPDPVSDPLIKEFSLVIDAAAEPHTSKLPHFFSLEGINALEIDWVEWARDNGLEPRFWLNPPFNYPEVEYFAQQCYRAWEKGGLTASIWCPSTCSKWFGKFIWETAEVRRIDGRVPFIPPDGVKASTNDRDSILAIWHPGEKWSMQPTKIGKMKNG